MFNNLFSEWPKSSIGVIHHDPYWDDYSSPIHSYRLSKKELRFAFPFSIFISRTTNYTATTPTHFPNTNLFILPKIRKLCNYLLRYLLLGSLPERSSISDELLDFVNNFKPDIIYTILGTNGLMEIILSLHQYTSMPMCIHIMDDWVTSNHSKGIFSLFNRLQMKRLFVESLKMSDCLLTISDSMSMEYFRRYSIASESISNAIDLSPNTKSSKIKNNPFTIVYVGSVLRNAQLSSILDIARVVIQLREKINIVFNVFCNPSAHDLLSHMVSKSFKLYDLPEVDSHYFSVIQNASCLVLPTNFDNGSYEHIKYSLPAKLPSYLSSKTIILLYGPPSSAQSDDAHRHGWALIVNKRCPQLLESAIMSLYHYPERYVCYTENALKIFSERHQLSTVRNRFKQILSNHVHNS